MSVKTVIILILLILLAVILIQNTKVVDVQLFFWKLSMSRIILINYYPSFYWICCWPFCGQKSKDSLII